MAGSINSVVMDVRNMQPIEGAAAKVTPGDHTATSGEQGRFSISLDAGTYELLVTKSGYEAWDASDLPIMDDVPLDLRIALWPTED